jgi:uncharacterized protein (TIGR02594 family)
MRAGVDAGHGHLVEGYAPASDNNDPQDYANAIGSHLGVPTTTLLSDLSDAQLDSMLDAMERKEGYHSQKDTRSERIVHTTSVTVSDGARPQAGLPARIRVGSQEHPAATDGKGRLPTIVHTKDGTPFSVFLATLQGEWRQVYDGVMGGQSRTVALFNPLHLFDAPTAPKKPPAPASRARRLPQRYVVEPGDTLAGIARRFHTTAAALQRDNPQIRDAARIYPAQVLMIHGGAVSAPATAPAPAHAPHAARPAHVTRSKEGAGAPLALIVPDQKQAPWMQVALAEAKKWAGKVESEITKTSNYPALNGNAFLTTLSGTANAWCGSFVNYCLSHATPAYTNWKNSFRARAVALDANFVEIKQPVFGAILLVGTHHVSFVYAKHGGGYVCLGGNQSDQINFTVFSKGVRFFVPLAYHAYALDDIAHGKALPDLDPDALNAAFGIAVKKKKGNATR